MSVSHTSLYMQVALIVVLLAAVPCLSVESSSTPTDICLAGNPSALPDTSVHFCNQEPNLEGSFFRSEVGSAYGREIETANDFDSNWDARVVAVRWWGGYPLAEPDGNGVTGFNLKFRKNNNGLPGAWIAQRTLHHNCGETLVDPGPPGVYEYFAIIPSVHVGMGSRWISIQAADNPTGPEWGWLDSTTRDSPYGSAFRCAYLGLPEWVQVENITGKAFDPAFTLYRWTGEIEEACCLPDVTCVFVLPAECVQLEGVPQGFGTVCDQVVCPPPPTGACCHGDEECIEATEEKCLEARFVIRIHAPAGGLRSRQPPGAESEPPTASGYPRPFLFLYVRASSRKIPRSRSRWELVPSK
jgi:hypothetical protein